jgi:DNA-binding NtrC family response regulator
MNNRSEKVRLLLVDDEAEFLEATAAALSRRGFEVAVAPDGRVALLCLATESFDVVVLDVKMPGVDGVEIFHRIAEQLPQLPVIMLTGHGTVRQAFETSRDGVYDYLTKPCDVDTLARIAREAAASRSFGAYRGSDARDAPQEIRVLLVDDDEELLEALVPALKRRKILASTATNAASALKLVERHHIDVAVVDIRMPGLNGLELLRRIGKVKPCVEVILLTGQPTMRRMVEAVHERAFAFLVKPQPVDALAAKIREAFHHRERRARETHERWVKKVLADRPD